MKRLLTALLFALAAPGVWAAGNPAAPATLKGEVLEARDVDAYTYLRLKTAQGETWAAVNRIAVKKGAQVTIENPVIMRNFASRSLDKTFDTIVFGTVAGTGGAASSAASGTAGAGTDLNQIHAGMAKGADAGVVKVAKAEGANARTVAEVNGERLALKDKPVVIRAKVVKVTASVMGKNWVHLRDGSGSAADGSNDLLVTSKDVPTVGDVVVARGTVRTDVNLGSGYAYKVLVEDASFGK